MAGAAVGATVTAAGARSDGRTVVGAGDPAVAAGTAGTVAATVSGTLASVDVSEPRQALDPIRIAATTSVGGSDVRQPAGILTSNQVDSGPT